jgi:hypothetical protein
MVLRSNDDQNELARLMESRMQEIKESIPAMLTKEELRFFTEGSTSTKEECECVENMLNTLTTASDLSKSANSILNRNPNKTNAAANRLRKEVEKLENNCATPIKNPEINFFIGERFKWAKEDLDKVLKSEGRNIFSATKAGDRFYSFILDNGTRMIKCQDKE